MDEMVIQSMLRWPNVPEVFGWLALDARGQWRLRNPASGEFERIGNAALVAFIARNYEADRSGRWYFQNGPQRVFVRVEITPRVFRLGSGELVDHCERPAGPLRGVWCDEHGALGVVAHVGAGVLDDRDLSAVSDGFDEAEGEAGMLMVRSIRLFGRRYAIETLPRSELGRRFGFDPDPQPAT